MENDGLKVSFREFRMIDTIFVRYDDTDPVEKLLTPSWKKRNHSDFISKLRSTLCYCVGFW